MYTEDKVKARTFLQAHGNDTVVKETLSGLNALDISHSERWSTIFDMLYENYPSYKGITTGLVYLIEDKEIF